MPIKDTSLLWKISFLIQIIGFLLGILAFSTNSIASVHESSNEAFVGLWQFCLNDHCVTTHTILEQTGKSKAWLYASRVMMSISLIGEFIAIIMTSLAIFHVVTKPVALTTLIVTGFSVLIGLIGGGVAGGESVRVFNALDKNIRLSTGWSFTLYMVVQVLFFVAGVIYLIDLRSKRPSERRSGSVNA